MARFDRFGLQENVEWLFFVVSFGWIGVGCSSLVCRLVGWFFRSRSIGVLRLRLWLACFRKLGESWLCRIRRLFVRIVRLCGRVCVCFFLWLHRILFGNLFCSLQCSRFCRLCVWFHLFRFPCGVGAPFSLIIFFDTRLIRHYWNNFYILLRDVFLIGICLQ